MDADSFEEYAGFSLKDPWKPCADEDEFKLFNWFITSGTPKGSIDEFYSSGFAKYEKRRAKSAKDVWERITKMGASEMHF